MMTFMPGPKACAQLACAAVVAAGGCAPDIAQDTDARRTEVVFDAAVGRLPLPSDLALEQSGDPAVDQTLPNPDPTVTDSAQADLNRYLDTLHGWPASAALTVPVDGPVNPATVTADAVMLFGLADDQPTPLEVGRVGFDEAAGRIVITPAEPLEIGARYGYVVTQKVGDPHGQPLVAGRPLFFAISSQPLVDAGQNKVLNDLLAGAVADDPDTTYDDAVALERARQYYKPVVDAAVAAGVDRSEIVAVSRWHTATDAFAVFEPADGGAVPFPNAFLGGDDGAVDLPVADDADELTAAVIATLNRRDGFSVTAPGYVPVDGAPLDAQTVTRHSVPLAYVDPLPTPYDDSRYQVAYRPQFDAITVEPRGRPFREGLTHAGIVTTDVVDQQGRALKPSSTFVLLRSRHPLFEDGASTVDQLTDSQAQTLEAARQQYQPLFSAAEALQVDRADIAVAWAFDTDVSTRVQQRLNAVAEATVNAGGSPAVDADPTEAQVDPPGFANVGLIQRQASFTSVYFLDAGDTSHLLDEPVDQQVDVIVSVPAESSCPRPADGYPIALIVHGSGDSRKGAVDTFADALAASPYCLATVAPDLPLSGARVQTGRSFLSADVIGTEHNFLQAVVDLDVLTEVIADDGLEAGLDADADTDLIDETQIGYVGMSLGALVGTTLLATDADVTVGALNVGGANISKILVNGAFSTLILPQLPGDLKQGGFEFFRTLGLLQWLIEPGDPWTFAPHVTNRPLAAVTYDPAAGEFSSAEALPANEIIVQMAGADQVIPNSATELLAAALGVSLEDTTFPGQKHAFIGSGGQAGRCALNQVGAWLSSGLSGDAALPADLTTPECLSGTP